MNQHVQISFECLPLRSVGRLDIPIDASPAFHARCERIKHALEKHGAHNSYFLYDARCTFHLTNDPARGSYLRWSLFSPSVIEPGVMARAADWNYKPAQAG